MCANTPVCAFVKNTTIRASRTVEDEVELAGARHEVDADLLRDLLTLREQLLRVVLRLFCRRGLSLGGSRR